MKKFAYRLKELRTEAKISTQFLGKEIGVSDAPICRWENDLADVKSDYLLALAKYFNVTTDFLLGKED